MSLSNYRLLDNSRLDFLVSFATKRRLLGNFLPQDQFNLYFFVQLLSKGWSSEKLSAILNTLDISED